MNHLNTAQAAAKGWIKDKFAVKMGGRGIIYESFPDLFQNFS